MASTLHLVLRNFIWRIEAATPQSTRGSVRAKFKHLNGTPPAQASGTSRGFEVRRVRRELPDGSTSRYSRIGDHIYEVELYFAPEMKPDAIAEVADQDAHVLIKALRDPASWLGYDDTHTTDEIGLMARWEAGDELVRQASTTALRLRFRAKVREIE